MERSDRAGDGGVCTGGGGRAKSSCGRGGDDEAAAADAGVSLEPLDGGREKEGGDDAALAVVCLPGVEPVLYMVGGLKGRDGLCKRMNWGNFFRGPLVPQGDRVEENCVGVNCGGDHIGAAAAAPWSGPPAATAAGDHSGGSVARSPSLSSSSDDE